MLSFSIVTEAAPLSGKALDKAVEKITRTAILIDTHNDIPSFTIDGADINNASKNHTDIPRLRQGGVGAIFFSVYVSETYVEGNHSANRALQMIDTVEHDIIDRYRNVFARALTAADIERAHKQGKIAALMGIEGGHAIEDSPRLLRDYYRLGVRYLTLTHWNTNNWADSSSDINKPGVTHHNGLTPLGKDIVREMNRLGMIVDISHVADKTFYDALETSTAPIIASHSASRALTNVPRNMTDDMIRALAEKGGVVQLNIYCNFISRATPPGKANLDDVVAHIDHLREIGGIDAIGIGTDFDGITCAPAGLEDVSKFPNLTRALLLHGYSSAEIRKIYGGNTLRVMRAVEAAAGK